MDSLDWQQLLHNKVEWVALTPQAWQQTVDSDSLVYNRRDRRGFDRTKMLAQLVQDAQSKGMRVLMKPHVWINRTVGNEWRSTMLPKGERWQKWSASYRDFIMEFARLSDSLGVDALCIGTELDAIAKAYPAYWTDLIQSIRKVYKGSLTYGANWDAFEDIQFWGQLDYIGVQAYFPLTKKQEPPVASLCAAWQSHYRKIRKLHQRYGKPVVFTEVGYRSVADAAHEPWTWTGETDHLTKRASPGTQSNCYEALFQVFWDQKWFAGALFWEWEGRFRNRDNDQVDFTPQGKPAEQVMARWFGKVSL